MSAPSNMLDKVILATSNALPKFNEHTIRGFREDQIKKIPNFLATAFAEAAKLFQGEVQFKGYRILNPEEVIDIDCDNAKYSSLVDITRTEQVLVEYMFEHKGVPFATQLYVPYITEDCIWIKGSKYYVLLALTDKVFYHIPKDQGIGIKILKAHLRFCRNLKYTFTATEGGTYLGHVVVAKIHLRHYKYTAEDIKTALLLYPLVKFGFDKTLEIFGIKKGHLTIENYVDESATKDFVYFCIRPSDKEHPGLYMKVHESVLNSRFTKDRKIEMQVVVEMHYCLQYFIRCKDTMYTNNTELKDALMNDPENIVWKVILGKTAYGLHGDSEVQVISHTKQHLDSLETYLDPPTIQKLKDIGIVCNDVYDLIIYVFTHIDDYVGNYFPSNLYNKQLNVLDLLLGNTVRVIFNKVYSLTNNRKGGRAYTYKEVTSAFKIGSKILNKIYACNQVIAGNPSHYNDNALVTVTGRKNRATFSSTMGGPAIKGGNKRKKSKSNMNLIANPEHRLHSSMLVVESLSHTQNGNPIISGTANPFCEYDENGNIVLQEETYKEACKIDPYTTVI